MAEYQNIVKMVAETVFATKPGTGKTRKMLPILPRCRDYDADCLAVGYEETKHSPLFYFTWCWLQDPTTGYCPFIHNGN